MPGLRLELATELIRSLPKAVRRHFAPAPEFARRALDWLAAHPSDRPETLPAALGRALRILTGELVDLTDWDPESVPDHLRVGFAVRPDDAPDAEPLATGKDLAALQTELAPRLSRRLAAAASALTRTGATRWEFGTVPDQVQLPGDGHAIVGYPALVDEGATVGLAVLDTPARQATSHRAGSAPAGAARHAGPDEVGGVAPQPARPARPRRRAVRLGAGPAGRRAAGLGGGAGPPGGCRRPRRAGLPGPRATPCGWTTPS